MQNLKRMIGRYMTTITTAIIIVVIIVAVLVHALDAQYIARQDAEAMLAQVEKIVEENQRDSIENNDLSYIFELLKVNVGIDCYAIEAESGQIVASTVTNVVDKNVSEIGLKLSEIESDTDGFHETVNGKLTFCVFRKVGDNWIGRLVAYDVLYANVPRNVIRIAICCILMGAIQVWAVTGYMNRCVVKGIRDVNEELRAITNGNLNENVDVKKSIEFVELSNYINEMVKSLIDNNRKLTYVLNKTNMLIGVYEYNEQTKRVSVTEHIPEILELQEEEMERLTSDHEQFKEFMTRIRLQPLEGEENIYCLKAEREKYIRIEEIYDQKEMFGVIIDVTEEITKRKLIEEERDIDLLTGLYNRRGLENRLSLLFKEPKKLKFGAMVMIDADDLKKINDKHGHDDGDIYLKKIGNIIKGFGINEALASRQGGDEFVLVLYDYISETELCKTIDTLKYIQNNSMVRLSDGTDAKLSFSFGYVLFNNRDDYTEMLKEADEKMYADKHVRKEKQKDLENV